MPGPFHVHLVAPSNEDSTYIKPLWVATLAALVDRIPDAVGSGDDRPLEA